MTNANDAFSASVIPFEVPEQMRAFAEKGVSQARDNYAKFKDAAETHNVTVEARYRDKSGEWKSAKGFRGSQLYAVIYCLERAAMMPPML